MAEGWARSIGPEHRIASAGIEAHGLNPRAVAVMQEAGIDITGQVSNTIDEFDLSEFNLIVTVCGDADEKCPVLPPGRVRIHWPLDDPARLDGAEETILAGFRASRDDIQHRVRELLQNLPAHLTFQP